MRELAVQLRVNRNTVSRAYVELESDGVIVTNSGAGSRVASEPPQLSVMERRERLKHAVEELRREARRLSVSDKELREAVNRG